MGYFTNVRKKWFISERIAVGCDNNMIIDLKKNSFIISRFSQWSLWKRRTLNRLTRGRTRLSE